MKEKIKDYLAVVLLLLVIAMWCTVGFDLPKSYLAVELICGLFIVGIISLIHRQ